MQNRRVDKIRLLETGHNNAVFNMALDEVLLQKVEEISRKAQNTDSTREKSVRRTSRSRIASQETPNWGAPAGERLFDSASAGVAVLRIYGWRPPAISIGYFQSMELEVQKDECRIRGIDVVRRLTGGGAVYHEAEVTYSFITNVFPNDILQSYRMICEPVVKALINLGLDARFVPLNDIVIGNGVKVSGNAQTRRNNAMLQHGTILLEVDPEKMFSVLKVPSEKMKDKIIADVKKRVTGIGRPFNEVAMALKSSFSDAFDCRFFPDNLQPDEYSKIDSLIREKYSLDSWNWRR